MKRKLFIIALTVVAAFACALALSACKPPDGKDAHEHKYEEEVFGPTCTERGYTVFTCDCGDSYVGDYVEALGHEFENYLSNDDATCTKDGTETAACSREGCDETDTVTIEGSHLGHDFGEYIPNNDATCIKHGTETAKCSRCTTTATRLIRDSFGGHNYVDYVCSYCGEYDPDAPFTLGLDYSLNEEDGSYVVGIGSATGKDIVIPSSYNGKAVTAIGKFAFYNCGDIESIAVPDSITSIGDYAFGNCKNLTSINIPDSVTSIGGNAFYLCSSLASVTIPGCVSFFGDYTFYGCESLTSVSIGNGVPSIGKGAFTICTSLTSISIPDSVTSIGSYAFYRCSSLASISIPDSVTHIGSSAFSGCTNLNYNIYDNAKYLGNADNPYVVLVSVSDTSITSFNINENTKIIYSAFNGCSSLTSIIIPDGVTFIGSSAFAGCSSLTDVYYTGIEEDWAKIVIGNSNEHLINATIHYNYNN